MAIDITHLVTFIIGAFTGAAGHYLGEKFTDQRRKNESEKKAKEKINEISKLMPDLLSEMKADLKLEGYESVREFVVLPSKTVCFNSDGRKRFAYFENEKDNLLGKVKILESYNLVVDITPGKTPIYKMTEEFVKLLK